MKLIDRIRPIAATPEYADFAERWKAFEEAGRTGQAGPVAQMIQYGNGLFRRAMAAAEEHAKAQPHFNEQVAVEISWAFHGCLRCALPELAAYVQFIDRVVRERPTAEAESA
jgi:hypothetical protein